MDKHTVFSLALQKLGEAEYQEGSPTQKVCEFWYKHVLALACARYNWTFLARETELSEGREEGNVRVYRRPVGCLKLTYVCKPDGTKVEDWRLTTEGIVVPVRYVPKEGAIRVRYQTDLAAAEGSLPDYAPEFNEGVLCLLASKMAMKVASDPKLGQQLEMESEAHFMRALTHDRQQDASNAIVRGYSREKKRSFTTTSFC